jgi:hypothetical protein
MIRLDPDNGAVLGFLPGGEHQNRPDYWWLDASVGLDVLAECENINFREIMCYNPSIVDPDMIRKIVIFNDQTTRQ